MAADRTQLMRLLREAGSTYDTDGVTALIAGVLAAPPEIGSSWHQLVADPCPPELAKLLDALKAEIAVDYRNGLEPEDFVRLPRPARLQLLREELARRGLAGFIVPRADQHQGQSVPPAG